MIYNDIILNLFILHYIILSEADPGLVKLVIMNNVVFNNQQQEIKIKRFKCVKQIRSSFFSNN